MPARQHAILQWTVDCGEPEAGPGRLAVLRLDAPTSERNVWAPRRHCAWTTDDVFRQIHAHDRGAGLCGKDLRGPHVRQVVSVQRTRPPSLARAPAQARRPPVLPWDHEITAAPAADFGPLRSLSAAVVRPRVLDASSSLSLAKPTGRPTDRPSDRQTTDGSSSRRRQAETEAQSISHVILRSTQRCIASSTGVFCSSQRSSGKDRQPTSNQSARCKNLPFRSCRRQLFSVSVPVLPPLPPWRIGRALTAM